jgi:hypothetical protein
VLENDVIEDAVNPPIEDSLEQFENILVTLLEADEGIVI